MRVRLPAALASAAICMWGVAAPAQTTMAPTAAPVVGPTAAPVPAPVGSAGPVAPSTYAPVMSPAPGAGTLPLPAGGPLALDARALRGTRTAAGYRLTGQALVNDACAAARFSRLLGNIFPPFFNVVQYRRPDRRGMLCIQHLMWVTIPALNVTSAAPPRFVTVHTKKGSARVPIPRGPVM